MRKCNLSEYQYINLVKKIINNGDKKAGRNGNVLSLFGEKMEFELNNYSVPILTTKKMAWRTCIKELLWFINGQTDNDVLKSQNVNIWNDNASKSFKKTRDIVYDSKGDLGPIYGHQWRHFNAEYNGCNEDYTNKGVDQLQNVISMLSDPIEKTSRRIFLSAWNPCQLDQMVLPPCHISSHFIVNSKDELSCAVYQRSGDIGLGVPFNIASYSTLTCLLAKHCGLKPGKLVHFIGDAHIYLQHVPVLLDQIKLTPLESPILKIYKQNVLERYTLDDFELYNYQYHKKIPMEMIA